MTPPGPADTPLPSPGEPDIRVGVQVRHLPQQSADPGTPGGRQVFQYLITIANHGGSSWQLLSREWHITDGAGGETVVQGEGVVGEQPLLAPGAHYSYNSFVTLAVLPGTMRGFYTFRDAWGAEARVAVPEFALALPPLGGPETRTLN